MADDDIQRAVDDLYHRLEHVTRQPDAEKRLKRAAKLVERIVKNHFVDDPLEKFTLGEAIFARQQFLTKRQRDEAHHALGIRNRDSHDSAEGDATEQEQLKASNYLIEFVRHHLDLLGKREGVTRSPKKTRDTIKTPTNGPRAGLGTGDGDPLPPDYDTGDSGIEIEFSPRPPRPEMEASPDDPTLSASTVAEYEFCPRAGILTHIGSYPDPEEELPSTGLLPWYELDAIEEAYVWSLYLLCAMPVMLVAVVTILSLLLLGHPLYLPLLFCIVLAWLWRASKVFNRWNKLYQRRFAAIFPDECDPDPNSKKAQAVDWWGLLNAGYEVRRPEIALADELWKINGKPRRILTKGSISIPVHRIRKNEGPVLPQHIVRAMAHCHLIETAEGTSSPFAVILYGNTYKGTTVPNIRVHRERFYSALERVRSMIKDYDAGERKPPEPVAQEICKNCIFGEPRKVGLQDKTTHYGKPIEPYLLHNGRTFSHCNCGDRFQWKPHNERCQRLER